MRSTAAQWFGAQTTEALAPAVTNWVTVTSCLTSLHLRSAQVINESEK